MTTEPTSRDCRALVDAYERATMRHQSAFAVTNRARINAEWDALPDHCSGKVHARKHLASLSPERREQLYREWR